MVMVLRNVVGLITRDCRVELLLVVVVVVHA